MKYLIILLLLTSCQTLNNSYLKFRYNHMYTDTISFEHRDLVFQDNFKNLDNWTIEDDVPYANNSTWLIKENVIHTAEGVHIVCTRLHDTRLYEGKTIQIEWQSGLMSTKNHFEHSWGVWVIEARMTNTFCAGWLLKKDRLVEGYNRTQITPEIDIFENIKGKIRHTIHYGYMEHPVYVRTSVGSSITDVDAENFHEYAVELTNTGYKFYIDGVLTAKFTSNDPEFVTNFPSYLILNNAGNKYSTTDYSTLIIKSVKVYK